MATFSKILRQAFGIEPIKITGEVYIKDNKKYITTRVSGGPNINISSEIVTIDSSLIDMSQAILSYIQPMVIFAQKIQYDDKCSNCIEILKYAIEHTPKDDDADAYFGWGWVLHNQEKYPEAIVKYQKSIELRPK